MVLWIVLAAMTAAVLALLLYPLMRRRQVAGARADYDLAVYRDQLAELDRDVERGVLDGTQAEAARTEIGRRMLSAVDAEKAPPAAAPARKGGGLVAAVLVLGLPAGALALYLHLGQPDLPSMPWSPDSPIVKAAAERAEFSALADRLAASLAADPGHPDGWLLLGKTYRGLERFADSAAAYAQAIAHGAKGPDVQADYGETLVFADDGQVGAKAATAFQAALKEDAANPRARFYLALARAQAGQFDLAMAQWLALEKDLPPDHPSRPLLADAIAAAARELGLDPTKLPGRAPPAP
jgi:cytochrome c-type biogenesis protein CcmH